MKTKEAIVLVEQEEELEPWLDKTKEKKKSKILC